MKTKHLLAVLLLAGSQLLFAQGEFKKSWETKVKVENKWNSCNSDLSLILMGDLKTFSMIDGTNGKTLWTINAKEKFGTKEVEDWTFLWAKEGEPVEVIYKKPKSDAKTTVYLDPRTGEPKTETTFEDKKAKNKKVKAKTMFADEAYDENTSTWVNLTYQDKKVKSAMGGTEMDVTVKASGGTEWATTIKAKCVRHLCDIMLSSSEPDMMVNVMIASGKVFVVYEGITALDLQSGKELWKTTFDNIEFNGGLKASQIIGRCPMPAVTEDAVYICDLSKGERAIKKLDINTGKVIWKGDKLSGDDIISQLFVNGEVLMAKFGGVIRNEKFIPNANGGVGDGTYKVEYTYEGTSEVRAFDAQSGKKIWSSETAFKDNKLGKSECSIMLNGENLVVCSEKFLLLVEPKTGKITKKEDLGNKEIGNAQHIFIYNDNFIVEGTKGVASFTLDGKRNYATSTDRRLMSEFKHEAYIVWTGKDVGDMNEFVRFDLATGKILGSLEGCYRPRFDDTGDYFIRFNDQTVTKYKTKL